jgi:hypothetical protein
MRKTILTIVCIAIVLSFAAFRYADDILQKLGVDVNAAHYSIEQNVFFTNEFSLPKAKFLAMAIKGDKKAMARELCLYVRQYCESDEFATAYQKYRESQKPTSEPPKMLDAETIKQMENLAKMYEEWSRNTSYDAKTRESFKTQAADIRKQLETEKDPHPNKTKWEKEYPVNPAVLIRKKLEEAVSIIESVDFNATTTANKYGQKIFDNPEYEEKSNKWKACYRAGKEVCDEVKLFIKNWLKEGIKTGKAMPFNGDNKTENTLKVTDSPVLKPEENTKNENTNQADTKPQNTKTEDESQKKSKPGIKNLKNKVLKKVGG